MRRTSGMVKPKSVVLGANGTLVQFRRELAGGLRKESYPTDKLWRASWRLVAASAHRLGGNLDRAVSLEREAVQIMQPPFAHLRPTQTRWSIVP